MARNSARRGLPVLLRNTAVVALVVLGVASIVLVNARSRADAVAAQGAAASYSPPALVTPTPTLPVVAVIGDDTTVRARSGVSTADRWPALLARSTRVDVRTFASSGAGYTVRGSDGRTFLAQASRLPADAQVVLIFGSANDSEASSADLLKAASRTIAAVQHRLPHASVLVVGPVATDDAALDVVVSRRLTLQDAAGAFGLRFIDPMQQAWLNGSVVSGSSLTKTDESDLAQHFETLISQSLPAN